MQQNILKFTDSDNGNKNNQTTPLQSEVKTSLPMRWVVGFKMNKGTLILDAYAPRLISAIQQIIIAQWS